MRGIDRRRRTTRLKGTTCTRGPSSTELAKFENPARIAETITLSQPRAGLHRYYVVKACCEDSFATSSARVHNFRGSALVAAAPGRRRPTY